jgi:endonuclease YncB( thermonuclease family)
MATLAPYSDSGVSADGEPITFLNGNTTLGTGTLSAGVTKLTLSSLPQGTNSLQARFGGDIGFASSTSNVLSLAVRPATLTATASNAARAYAAPNPVFTGTVSGAVNADTFTVTGTTTATPSSKVGTYPIVPSVSGSEISNYTVTKVNGTLTVTKTTPVIKWATPAVIFAGVPLSSTQLNATASTPGTFTYDPASGTVLPEGTSTLSAKFTPTDMTDYESVTTTVQLAVRRAALTAIAANASRAYTAPNPVFTGTVSGAVNGDTFTVTGTTTATPSSKVGTYPIVPSVSGSEISNYTVTKVNGTLTVTKATPVVTWAAPAEIIAGVPLSSTQLNATASVPGTFAYDPASGTVLPTGTSTLSAKFTPTDMTDYESVTTTIQLVVGAVPDYTISVKPSTLTIAAGSTGSAAFTITPSGGFNEAVNFSCSGLPANSTCKFSPATVIPNGASVTSTVTIQTNVESAKSIAPQSNVWLALVSGSSTVSLCGIFVLWFIPRKKRPAGWRIFGVAILIVAGMNIGLFVAGCGGGGSSPSTGGSSPSGGGQNSVTPAGTSTVVVKASSGVSGTSDSHTANLTVVITN